MACVDTSLAIGIWNKIRHKWYLWVSNIHSLTYTLTRTNSFIFICKLQHQMFVKRMIYILLYGPLNVQEWNERCNTYFKILIVVGAICQGVSSNSDKTLYDTVTVKLSCILTTSVCRVKYKITSLCLQHRIRWQLYCIRWKRALLLNNNL